MYVLLARIILENLKKMLGVKKILTQEEKAYFFCWLVFFQVASNIWCNLGLLRSASPIFCCTLLLFTLRYFLSTPLYSLYLSITLYILFLKKIYPFSSRNIFLELHIHIPLFFPKHLSRITHTYSQKCISKTMIDSFRNILMQ